MYPNILLPYGIQIYPFGLTLTLCFFLFIWMLKKLSFRFGYDFSVFKDNLLWFFLSTFVFSRLFYVILKWTDIKYIDNPIQFFVDSDFNFSLFGAVFGFFLVLFIFLKFSKETIIKYIDGIVLSMLFVMVIGYIGSFFGGQVFGNESHTGLEILYPPESAIPYTVPIFPLPFVYAFFTFLIFSTLYILSLFVHIRGFIGYVGIIAFSAILLIFEYFSGKIDIIRSLTGVSFNQIVALGIIIWISYELYKLMQVNTGEKKVTIIK